MNGWINKLNRLFKCCDDIAPGNRIRLKLWYMPALRSNGKRIASYRPCPILSSCRQMKKKKKKKTSWVCARMWERQINFPWYFFINNFEIEQNASVYLLSSQQMTYLNCSFMGLTVNKMKRKQTSKMLWSSGQCSFYGPPGFFFCWGGGGGTINKFVMIVLLFVHKYNSSMQNVLDKGEALVIYIGRPK